MAVAEVRGMPCPNFVDDRLCRCMAVTGLLVPSVHERERFCLTSSSENCPTFRASEERGRPISLQQYYSLWIVGWSDRESGARTDCTV